MDKFTQAEIDEFLKWASFSCSLLNFNHEKDDSFIKTVNETAADILEPYKGPDIYKGVDQLFYINYDIDESDALGFSEFSSRTDIPKIFVVDINFFYGADAAKNLKILSKTVTYH